MSKQYNGSHEVNIPIDAILDEYAAWSDEIVEAVGREVLKETRQRAKGAFDDKTGLLRKKISRKKSRFDKDTHIVGAFAPHAHLVEFGSGVRVDKRGKVSGHMPASPFLGPAGEAVQGRLHEIAESVVSPTVEVKK